MPRKSPGRRRPSVHNQDDTRVERHLHHTELSHASKDPPPPLSTHVLARIAELRPVLPRPPRNDGPLHDPSSSMPHSHSSRHHTHENMYFSPYGRAYEHVHTHDHYETKSNPQMGDTRAFPVRHQPPVRQNTHPGTQSGFDTWQTPPGVFPSSCSCGDSCRCPGCSQHSNAPIPPSGAYAACSNPASCSFCLDCTILSLPPSAAPLSSDPSSDSQTREFEEWLTQISASPTSANTVGMPTSFNPYDLSMNPVAAVLSPNPNHNANSNSNLSHSSHPRSSQHLSSAVGRCQGRCKCPNGTCSCPAQCCGYGQECERDQQCNSRAGSGSPTTFAVSGECNTRCNSLKSPDPPSTSASVGRRTGARRVPDYMTMTTVRDGLTASVANRPSPVGAGTGTGAASFYPDPPSYLSIGDAPSRSSSSSSLSSRMSGRSPISAVCGASFRFIFSEWCSCAAVPLECVWVLSCTWCVKRECRFGNRIPSTSVGRHEWRFICATPAHASVGFVEWAVWCISRIWFDTVFTTLTVAVVIYMSWHLCLLSFLFYSLFRLLLLLLESCSDDMHLFCLILFACDFVHV